MSAGARLAPFDIQEVRDITMYDELELDTLGDEQTALFLMMSALILKKVLKSGVRNSTLLQNVKNIHKTVK